MRCPFTHLILFSLVFLPLVVATEATGSSLNDKDAHGLSQSLGNRPISRARSEIEVKKLRQLIAAKKIDADQLIKAIHEIAGRTSER